MTWATLSHSPLPQCNFKQYLASFQVQTGIWCLCCVFADCSPQPPPTSMHKWRNVYWNSCNCELMHKRSSILAHLPLGASTFMSPCQNNYISFCSQAVSEKEKVFKGCAVPSKPIPSEHNRLTVYLELWVPPNFHISLWQSLTFYF